MCKKCQWFEHKKNIIIEKKCIVRRWQDWERNVNAEK